MVINLVSASAVNPIMDFFKASVFSRGSSRGDCSKIVWLKNSFNLGKEAETVEFYDIITALLSAIDRASSSLGSILH